MGAPLPVLLDLDAQVEENPVPEQGLYLLPRFGSDGLDRGPAFPYDDLVTTNARRMLGTELFEFICNENEKSTKHMGPHIK